MKKVFFVGKEQNEKGVDVGEMEQRLKNLRCWKNRTEIEKSLMLEEIKQRLKNL